MTRGVAVQRKVPDRTARKNEVAFSSPTALLLSPYTFKAAPVLHRDSIMVAYTPPWTRP